MHKGPSDGRCARRIVCPMRAGDHASDDILSRLHRTTIAAWGKYAGRVGGRTVEDRGITYVVGTDPTPVIINSAFRTDPTVTPADLLARSRAFYSGLGHQFTLVTSDDLDADVREGAAASGWTMALALPAMVCRNRLPERPLPPGASLRRVDPVADIASFRYIERDGFASDEDEVAAVESVFGSPAALAADETIAVIASIDGIDAAVAMADVIDGVTYVGFVATLPAFRRRGLGDTVTRAVTNGGFDGGAEIAMLEASPMGRSVYERMGFAMIDTDRIWVPPDG
jgi:ribosomal protein S18 acetylase RimI-like enzyme